MVVGRWLSSKPRLLLADDPTKGIDVKARTDLHQMFAKLAKEGNAVVMISNSRALRGEHYIYGGSFKSYCNV